MAVKAAEIGGTLLLSRAQARRLVAGGVEAGVMELDFADVAEIGQAFADELFRVFVNEHPHVELRALNAGPGVLPMIRRVQQAR